MSGLNESEAQRDFDSDPDCAVCLEPLPESNTNGDRHVVKCSNGHLFCSSCIDTWAKESKGERKCPLCREGHVSRGTYMSTDQVQRIRNKLKSQWDIQTLQDVDIFITYYKDNIFSQLFLPLYASENACLSYTNFLIRKFDAPEFPIPNRMENSGVQDIDFTELLSTKIERKLREVIEPCYE
jgi:Ring finger domain